jgi:hypothetical protein
MDYFIIPGLFLVFSLFYPEKVKEIVIFSKPEALYRYIYYCNLKLLTNFLMHNSCLNLCHKPFENWAVGLCWSLPDSGILAQTNYLV